MTRVKAEYHRDRALRDAAKTNLDNDMEFMKADVERRGIGTRLADYATDNSQRAARNASAFARDNTGSVAGGTAILFAALAAWIFWDPLMRMVDEMLGREPEGEDDATEQDWLSSIWETHVKSRFGDRK